MGEERFCFLWVWWYRSTCTGGAAVSWWKKDRKGDASHPHSTQAHVLPSTVINAHWATRPCRIHRNSSVVLVTSEDRGFTSCSRHARFLVPCDTCLLGWLAHHTTSTAPHPTSTTTSASCMRALREHWSWQFCRYIYQPLFQYYCRFFFKPGTTHAADAYAGPDSWQRVLRVASPHSNLRLNGAGGIDPNQPHTGQNPTQLWCLAAAWWSRNLLKKKKKRHGPLNSGEIK